MRTRLGPGDDERVVVDSFDVGQDLQSGRVEQVRPDFASREAYEEWLWEILKRANRTRRQRLSEELQQMKVLRVKRLADFTQHRVKVTSWSTIRVKCNAYSVPSRLIREWVDVRLHEDRLEMFYGGQRQLVIQRRQI